MTAWKTPEQRVVITGLGAITPNGLDMRATWEGVSHGRSAIAAITVFDTTSHRVKIAGEAHGFGGHNSCIVVTEAPE